MKRNLITDINSSFLSCEKDTQTILKKLFIESQPHSDDLKRLLVINTPDCLDNKSNPAYNEKIKEMTMSELRKQGYIRLEPKIKMPEHEEVKAYLMIDFDNFIPSENTQYRDCTISFDILCHSDYWDIGDYRLRPIKIMGIIDGILNNSKLSGIGTLNFLGCNKVVLDETLSGYSLMYLATHGNDDKLEGEDE